MDHNFLLVLLIAAASAQSVLVEECEVTPTEPLGPFYQSSGVPEKSVICIAEERPDSWPPLDYNLVRNITIYGSVLGSDCQPIDGTIVRLDAWQTDSDGEYDPFADENSHYCRGIIPVEMDGSYILNTTYPGKYPQRPISHIHFRVEAVGYVPLVTQTYFKDDVFYTGSDAPNWLDLGQDDVANFDFVLQKLS
eukprot:TRINITY_DN8082_c2_g1_i2.p1 TRINITY_DN8082_c2_g1~~TRINITY_DN8082_c2_g1_i2.p1  ORF type:complete len:193 (+),score=31.22 TRINITY_DN8082_c2_g1_i2:186-764(+)